MRGLATLQAAFRGASAKVTGWGRTAKSWYRANPHHAKIVGLEVTCGLGAAVLALNTISSFDLVFHWQTELLAAIGVGWGLRNAIKNGHGHPNGTLGYIRDQITKENMLRTLKYGVAGIGGLWAADKAAHAYDYLLSHSSVFDTALKLGWSTKDVPHMPLQYLVIAGAVALATDKSIQFMRNNPRAAVRMAATAVAAVAGFFGTHAVLDQVPFLNEVINDAVSSLAGVVAGTVTHQAIGGTPTAPTPPYSSRKTIAILSAVTALALGAAYLPRLVSSLDLPFNPTRASTTDTAVCTAPLEKSQLPCSMTVNWDQLAYFPSNNPRASKTLGVGTILKVQNIDNSTGAIGYANVTIESQPSDPKLLSTGKIGLIQANYALSLGPKS